MRSSWRTFTGVIAWVIVFIALLVGVPSFLLWLSGEGQWEPVLYGATVIGGFAFSTAVLLRQRDRPPTSAADQQAALAVRNRVRFLQKLKAESEHLLVDPLLELNRITLGLTRQPGAVNPLNPDNRLAAQSDSPLPPGTTITDVFDGCANGLLILGLPGAGKTTLLHELAVNLITRAQTDDKLPIPVILNLSSWAQEQKPLTEWIVETLIIKHAVPCEYAQNLLAADELLLLLDGLDEMRETCRAACVKAINAFRRDGRGLISMVVCSRLAEYEHLQDRVRLELDTAVQLLPLTDQQVGDYLDQAGARLSALREGLGDDVGLRGLAQTPLWLNVMIVAYANLDAGGIREMAAPNRRRAHLFKHYVMGMFVHKGVNKRAEQRQAIHYLRWLAGQMQPRSLTDFYIEQLQPDWLPLARLVQYSRAVQLAVGLADGLMFGLAFGLAFGLGGGLTFGLAFGLGGGLVVGRLSSNMISDRTADEIKVVEQLGFSWVAFAAGCIEAIRERWRHILAAGPLFGLIFGLVAGLAMGLEAGLEWGLAGWLGSGLSLGLALALVRSLRGAEIEIKSTPNQGIRRSVRSAFYVTLGAVLPVVLAVGLVFGLAGDLVFGLASGLAGGLWLALEVGLLYGRLSVMQHLVLRGLLWRDGFMPRNIARFLDHCASLILVRREGGGYRFYHLELRDYFATLESDEIV